MSNDHSPRETSTKQPKHSQGTEDIVRQHLEDPNHIITDEDIKNVVVGSFEDAQDYEGELPEGNSDSSEGDEGGDDQKPGTPWDVVK